MVILGVRRSVPAYRAPNDGEGTGQKSRLSCGADAVREARVERSAL
jgi:hypothetical protein